MEKFLNIPVTNEGNQLVPATDVKLVEVGAGGAADTTTVITYGAGNTITLTHASVGTPSATNSGNQMRNFVQSSIVAALSTAWTEPAYEAIPDFAVSNIDYA